MQEPPIVKVRNHGNNIKVVTIPADSNIFVGEQVVILRVEEYIFLKSNRRG